MSKHEELIERLRMLADAVKLSPNTEWQLWTSNSWRRFQGVLEPVTQKDGHPDLHAAPGVLEFIEAASPAAVTALLDALEAQAREIEATERQVEILTDALAESRREGDGWRKDAERWRFAESAPSAITLRLHNLRPDQRAQYIDAAKGEAK